MIWSLRSGGYCCRWFTRHLLFQRMSRFTHKCDGEPLPDYMQANNQPECLELSYRYLIRRARRNSDSRCCRLILRSKFPFGAQPVFLVRTVRVLALYPVGVCECGDVFLPDSFPLGRLRWNNRGLRGLCRRRVHMLRRNFLNWLCFLCHRSSAAPLCNCFRLLCGLGGAC